MEAAKGRNNGKRENEPCTFINHFTELPPARLEESLMCLQWSYHIFRLSYARRTFWQASAE